MITFAHSGGTGDIIYSLYVVKKICEEKNTKCNIYIKRSNACNHTVDIYETLKLLLLKQEYISNVYPIDRTEKYANLYRDVYKYDISFFLKNENINFVHSQVFHNVYHLIQ
jgi:hypothetical protein